MIIWKQNAFYSSKSQQAFPPKKLQLGVLDSHNKGKEVLQTQSFLGLDV